MNTPEPSKPQRGASSRTKSSGGSSAKRRFLTPSERRDMIKERVRRHRDRIKRGRANRELQFPALDANSSSSDETQVKPAQSSSSSDSDTKQAFAAAVATLRQHQQQREWDDEGHLAVPLLDNDPTEEPTEEPRTVHRRSSH